MTDTLIVSVQINGLLLVTGAPTDSRPRDHAQYLDLERSFEGGRRRKRSVRFLSAALRRQPGVFNSD
jgi:hypothetical protein